MSCKEQECQESLIQRKIPIQQNRNRRPQIFVKVSFRKIGGSKLSGLNPFDNIRTSCPEKLLYADD